MVKSLIYKDQSFQKAAVDAVCDLFRDQPYLASRKYVVDSGKKKKNQDQFDLTEYGFSNAKIVPDLTDEVIFERVKEKQIQQQIIPSQKYAGRNYSIQMETGTGKTYVYINTIFELNKRYGWSKFIIVVPSVAIREGVKSSFESMQAHFAMKYEKKARYFIYDSKRIATDIKAFVSQNSIQVMIINKQAFNASGKDARRIDMELEEFGYRVPKKVIAAMNPIMIIDEPQSVDGPTTTPKLKEFNPLFTLRYSATHREYYNLVYRLDSMDAYNMKLVKSISVVGMKQSGTSATAKYVYLERIQTFKNKNPVAYIGFDKNTASGPSPTIMQLSEKDDLYVKSGGLTEYSEGYTITDIDAYNNTVTFVNNLVLGVGDYVGKVSENVLRQLQIRETVAAHLEKEEKLFEKGIKVLSLFFIDDVANYRSTVDGECGLYGQLFEQEYKSAVNDVLSRLDLTESYRNYLMNIRASETHNGYFSQDKKTGAYKNDIKDKKEGTSDDVDAYNLIMRDKTTLLDLKKSKIRFIFSHSALREGWDNPNVFQICTLKEPGDSDIRKMQEVGRGLRLCVNQNGERMDESILGDSVQTVNELTVITSESYADFASSIQRRIADTIGQRPIKVTAKLFEGTHKFGDITEYVSVEQASEILVELRTNKYIDREYKPTEKYKQDAATGKLDLDESMVKYTQLIIDTLNAIVDPSAYKVPNRREENVQAEINQKNLDNKDFKDLWKIISRKSTYNVNFDTDELVKKCIASIDDNLRIKKVMVEIERGSMKSIESKEAMENSEGFSKTSGDHKVITTADVETDVTYDLIGEVVKNTNLTRKAVADILSGISSEKFELFYVNPEVFITNVSKIINEQKGNMILAKIEYHPSEDYFTIEDTFTSAILKGKLGKDMFESSRNIHNYVKYDSTTVELPFAQDLESSDIVAMYAKIPVRETGFKISTPVGFYTPDWIILFKEGTVKHAYFVAETKGTLSTLDLKGPEETKISCAKKHFESICGNQIKYDFVKTYKDVLDLIKL